MTKPVLPSRRKPVNEGTAFDLDLTHLDKTKTKTIPLTLDYRIDDLTNSREILDWTNVPTPGSTNTINVTGAQNTLQGQDKQIELRQITTRTTDATNRPANEIFHYKLVRIFDQEDQKF